MRRIVLSSLAALSLGLAFLIAAAGRGEASQGPEAENAGDIIFSEPIIHVSGTGASCNEALADLFANADAYLTYLYHQCIEAGGVPSETPPLPYTTGNMPQCSLGVSKWTASFPLGTGYRYVCSYPAEIESN